MHPFVEVELGPGGRNDGHDHTSFAEAEMEGES